MGFACSAGSHQRMNSVSLIKFEMSSLLELYAFGAGSRPYVL